MSKVSDSSKILRGDIAAARPGDPCPNCSAELQETRGIEIGNIFHLGTKYSESMDCTYLDSQGKRQFPIMGCYGIGVTRLLPSVIEEHHDDSGIRFPLSVAPFQLHLCSLMRKDATVVEASDRLYRELNAAGIETLYDDRDEKPGSQFADADLIGVPFRIVVSPKTLAQGAVEFTRRDKSSPPEMIPLDGLKASLLEKISQEMTRFAV